MFNSLGVDCRRAIIEPEHSEAIAYSGPRLTANIYTHVMVEGKAAALAKLPAIQAAKKSSAVSATGTDDTIAIENAPKSADRLGDRNFLSADGQIRTYRDGEKGGFEVKNETPETQKSPISRGNLAEREGV